MSLMSSTNLSLTLDVTTNKYFYSAARNAKIYLKNYNSSIIPRLILLTETFIQTCNHSYTVHLFKSSDTIFFTSLDTFSSTSWTLFLFLLGPYFFFFLSLWGPLLNYLLSSIHGSPPHLHNWVDSGRTCLGVPAIKSAAPMSPHPRVNLLVPVPAATYNTCSAHN